MKSIGRLLGMALLVALAPVAAQSQDTTRTNPAQTMRELRVAFLSASPASLGFTPTREYPRVFGVAMDWPLGEHTATIVAALDGTASLYTTSTFGVIGGAGHEAVRTAAQRFVKAAEAFHDDAVPTRAFPYPAKDKVRFYVRSFEGVRVLEADAPSVYATSGTYSAFFRAGQAVVTELRKVTQHKR